MRKLYLFFTLATFSSSLLCMDEQCYKQVVKDIMVHEVIYLSHDSICALALVDKKYNKTIQETVNSRKNYLRKCAFAQNMPIIEAETTWHKHGSAYVFLGERQGYGPMYLMFRMGYLQDNGDVSNMLEDTFFPNSGYNRAVAHWPNEQARPCFNSKGEAYFYGIQYVDVNNNPHHSEKHIIEFSLSTKRSPKRLRCLMDSEGCWRLVKLLEFPSLLQAFLQSTQVHEKLTYPYLPQGKRYGKDDMAKMYNIKGVTIPDDFRSFKEHHVSDERIVATSFDQLLAPIKKAILDKYAKQQREKMMLEELPK